MHSSHAGRHMRALKVVSVLVIGLASPRWAWAQKAPAPLANFGPQPTDTGRPVELSRPGDVGRAGDTTRPVDRVNEEPKSQNPRMFRVGLVAGVGAPSLMNFGITTKITPYMGLGVTLGLIPTVKVPLYGEATIAYQEYDAYLRVYPFGGGFFLGSGIGYAKATGSWSQNVNTPAAYGISAQQLSLSSEASVKAMVITPKIGYLYTADSGFLVGIDLGAQIPVSPSQTNLTTNLPASLPASYTLEATSQVNNTLARIGQQVIPTLNVNLGWMF